MAPFKRGSASVRYHGSARGSSQGQRRGNGRGGRGHKSTQKNRTSSSFKITRTEEKAGSDSEHSDPIAAQTIDPSDSSSGYSDDEAEQGLDEAQIKPYNLLLQRLAAIPQPKNKKRKINETEEKELAESSENDKDLVEEPEDLEIWGEDDHVDSDDDVGPQGGNLGFFNVRESLYLTRQITLHSIFTLPSQRSPN